jgi:hypothetical protein
MRGRAQPCDGRRSVFQDVPEREIPWTARRAAIVQRQYIPALPSHRLRQMAATVVSARTMAGADKNNNMARTASGRIGDFPIFVAPPS